MGGGLTLEPSRVEVVEDVKSERDTASEMLSRLSLGDWTRIWLTMLPRHLPHSLARQVQLMNTGLALRSVIASLVLGLPVAIFFVVVVLPDTSTARVWGWFASVTFITVSLLMAVYMWMLTRGTLSAARFNLSVWPWTIAAGISWGTLPAVVGPEPIDRFYLVSAMAVFMAILSVVFHAGHWPIAMLFSITIAIAISVTFQALDRPNADITTGIIFLSVATAFVFSVVGCGTLVRSQLQTVLAADRQLTIDLLLNSYARSGNDWVWGVDEKTVFESVPDRMRIAARGDPRVQPGRSLLELVHDDAAATKAIREFEAFDTIIQTEGPHGKGELQLWGRPVVVGDRRLGFRGVGSDLGTAKRAAEAERAAERFDAMVSVTSGINHDFNNQLATVLSAVELARLSVGELDQPLEYLDRAIEACLRSRALTADLAAALGLKTVAEAVQFDLSSEVQSVVEDVAQIYPNMSIQFEAERSVAAIADPSHVRRATRNIVENACQANERHRDGSGVVKVVVASGEIGGVDFARVRVADQGPGITDEIRDRIVEPFFTTRSSDGGTGLGLAVANGLTKQAGGSMSYENGAEGAIFELLFPGVAQVGGALNAVRSHSNPGVNLAAGEYLIVEDDQMVASTLIDWIELNGASVTWVSTVEEGIALADDGSHRFRCVITDIVLPDGEGYDVAAAFRRGDPHAPVVYVSGFTRNLPTDLDKLLHAPFVSKPFVFTELLRALGAVGAIEPSKAG